MEAHNFASTVLIVDDLTSGRETLGKALEEDGYHLLFAVNGNQALEIAANTQPDLILLDVMMPQMDGYEVCSRIRENPQLSSIPIILITVLDDPESRLQGIEAGADDFISKPISRVELRARVRTITKLNRYRHLLAEHRRFEWVAERAEDGFVIIDDKDRVLYMNPSAKHYFSVSNETKSEYRFLQLSQQYYHCEPSENWTEWPPICEKKEHVRYLIRPESDNAQALWLKITCFEDPSSDYGKTLLCLKNVTEKIKTQRNTWVFHTMLSHKLFTPLNGIIGASELINMSFNSLDNSELFDLNTTIHSSARRLEEELKNIMDYQEASLSPLSQPGYEIQQLRGLLQRICETLKLANVDLKIHNAVQDSKVFLSEHALELILLRVLENSIKFHPQRLPEITISVDPVSGEKISIKITDNGSSIEPEHLSQVWAPYYQSEKNFTGEIKGMGLGLPTVANILWQVGGSCRLENRPGRPGIEMELVIPLAQELPSL